MVRLLPGEKQILYLKKIKVLYYRFGTGQYFWDVDAYITNKRVALVFYWLTLKSLPSRNNYYYKENEFKKFRKYNDGLILKCEGAGKGRFLGDFVKLLIGKSILNIYLKLYTSKNYKVEKIVKKFFD
ncbi:hypothetical protein HYS31_07875 [Candidatus Woesearchaeota archaeon]|nr:hypothetical protein [Candidatus Woesearchaeota archaeon]